MVQLFVDPEVGLRVLRIRPIFFLMVYHDIEIMYSKHLKTIPRKIHECYGRLDGTRGNITNPSNELRNITIDKKQRNTFSRENFDGTHQRHLARVNVVSTVCDLLYCPHYVNRPAADNVSRSTSRFSLSHDLTLSLSYFGHKPHGQSISLSLSLTSTV